MFQFKGKIHLKAHFGNTSTRDPNSEATRFKPPTNKPWVPQQVHHTAKTFIETFENDIKEDLSTVRPRNPNNINKDDSKALDNLNNRTDIIIINAYKVGAVTILDLNDYINDADKQLRDPECYKDLTMGQTIEHTNIINDTIEVFKIQHKIPDKIADCWKSRHPKTPTLRLRPKAHQEGHSGRPLVSSINSHSTKISEYVDFHLQSHVLKIISYIKDTNDFLNHLEKNPASTSRNSYFVSALHTLIFPTQKA